jgi:hypothetical protein
VAREKHEKPSYLKEMLTHKLSMYGFFGAIAGGAALSVVAAPLAVVPLVGFAAVEGVAALFIPGSRWWQDRVDAKQRKEHRERLRGHVLAELNKRNPALGAVQEWRTYERLCDRVDVLTRTASSKLSQVTQRDAERLDDATVNYLSLWLTTWVMRERQEALRGENVDRRIAELERRLSDDSVQGADRLRFEKAKDDLDKVRERSLSVESHLASARSGMITLADGIEEIFENVMKNPNADDVRPYLDLAIEQVRLADNVEAEMQDELANAFDELARKSG